MHDWTITLSQLMCYSNTTMIKIYIQVMSDVKERCLFFSFPKQILCTLWTSCVCCLSLSFYMKYIYSYSTSRSIVATSTYRRNYLQIICQILYLKEHSFSWADVVNLVFMTENIVQTVKIISKITVLPITARVATTIDYLSWETTFNSFSCTNTTIKMNQSRQLLSGI